MINPPHSNLLHQRERRPICASWLLPLLLLALPAAVQAQFTYTNNNGTITITGYTGPGGAVTIPDAINGLPVTSIGTNAFVYCQSLASITISTNVTSIGPGAFYICYGLTRVSLPNSVTSIGDLAFNFCTSLNSVTIPNSTTHIGDEAFFGCASLIAITVDALNPVYSSVDGVLFNKTRTTLIQCPGGKTGSYKIPDSVTSILAEAFGYCRGLTTVTVPGSVTSIGNYAFDNSFHLSGIYFQGNAPSVGSVVFILDNNATVYYLPGTTGWGATFGGRPTAPWYLPNPVILDFGPSFGVQTNHFGFIISWATNVPVVVEASNNLANPNWSPLATNTLTSGSSYFSDLQWTNYPARFYRLRSP
jgi:hypothetical protein